MNLFVYLVECRDKTFDQKWMRAFKALKAYGLFCRWVCQEHVALPTPWEQSDSHTGILSLLVYKWSCFACLWFLSCKTGDVYTAQCNWVSGNCWHWVVWLCCLHSSWPSRGTCSLWSPFLERRTSPLTEVVFSAAMWYPSWLWRWSIVPNMLCDYQQL